MADTQQLAYQELLSTDVNDLMTLKAVEDSRKLAENYLSIVQTIYAKGIQNDSQDVLDAAELHNSMVPEDELLDLEDEETLNNLLDGLQTIYDDENLQQVISEYIEELDTRAVTLKRQLVEPVVKSKKSKKPKKAPSVSVSASESDDEPAMVSKKQKATKSKSSVAVETPKVPRNPAGSSGIQKVLVLANNNSTGIDKAFQAVFWNVQAPGLAKTLELKDKFPHMNKLKANKLIKDAKRQDLLTKYTPSKGKTFKDLLKKNRTTIEQLTLANNKFSACFGRYTDKARFQLRITNDVTDSLREKHQKNPEMFIVDMAKVKNMQDLIYKRLLSYEYWADAKGTRPPQEVVPLEFNKKYSRHVLTPEAVAWVTAESFRTPAGISVTHNNKTYTNLKKYLADVLGKPFADTYLAQGLITNGTITTLLYKTLTKQDITPDEIKKRIAAGDKTTASKFGWSTAMKSTLGTMPATWDRQVATVGKKSVNVRVLNTNSTVTVFDLLHNKTKASAQALRIKRGGTKGLSPFYSTNQHLWGKDITSLKEYLWDNSTATKQANPEFFAARNADNEDYLLSIIKESKAIKTFKKEIDYAVSEVKEGTKKKRSL